MTIAYTILNTTTKTKRGITKMGFNIKEKKIMAGIVLLNKENYKESLVPSVMSENEYNRFKAKLRKIKLN